MLGSRAPYATQRNERDIRSNMKRSEDVPEFGPSSEAFRMKKIAAIKRGNEYNMVQEYRQAQETLINARADEDRQMSELVSARRATLRGEAGRVRAGLRAAQQVNSFMQM